MQRLWTPAILLVLASGCSAPQSMRDFVDGRLPRAKSSQLVDRESHFAKLQEPTTTVRRRVEESNVIPEPGLLRVDYDDLDASQSRPGVIPISGEETTPLELADGPSDNQINDLNSTPFEPSPTGMLPKDEARRMQPLPVELGGTLSLDQVVESVYRSYPLLQSALFSRNIAFGDQVSASGAFDLKLKGASELGPPGFYETYRNNIGIVQPLHGGADVFAGYRVGRGSFQPWYQERQTNGAGEFKAGVSLPLLQDVDIDARRAELWKAEYGRQLAEPEIQAQLIGFIQEASYAYWGWMAACASYDIAEHVLELAEDRNDRIRSQVDANLLDPPELTDNLRLVAERRAKLADAKRKMDQTAAKLSLYLRDGNGQPILPRREQYLALPQPATGPVDNLAGDIDLALQLRPELQSLDWIRRQIEVEFAQAENLTLPELDAIISGSQDMGQPTSKKRDKSRFEFEAGLYLDVPIQRRKAQGKITALEGKLAQLAAKRRMVADKISVDVQYAAIAIEAALIQVAQTEEAVRLAEDLAERERQNQKLGLSDLLKVTLREQYAAESAQKHVDAIQQYFQAQADYRAALGTDRVE
ncbi:MAG: TolC family protein [Planctomycetaceae bacterium]